MPFCMIEAPRCLEDYEAGCQMVQINGSAMGNIFFFVFLSLFYAVFFICSVDVKNENYHILL
jgi:hypothetical protein